MKTRAVPLALCSGLLLAAATFPTALHADDAPATNQAKLYDETADGQKQVADAVAVAGKEHKRILLQFGANWCGWCHKLHGLFERDKSIRDELKADYVIALIDVNQGHNKNLVNQYGAKGFGLPFLVVLESDGKFLIAKHSDDFEEGDHHNPQKVLAFLKEMAPKRQAMPPGDQSQTGNERHANS